MSVFNLCVTPGARWGLGVLERGVSTYNSVPIAILSTTMYLPANLFKFHFLVLQVLNLRELIIRLYIKTCTPDLRGVEPKS